MLAGTDVCIAVFFVWKETKVPRGNPHVWLGDHMTISHANTGYRTWVAVVRGNHVTTVLARQHNPTHYFNRCTYKELTANKGTLPAMFVRPRVAGVFSLSTQSVLSIRIHLLSNFSISPPSWNSSMAREIGCVHGLPLRNPTPSPDRPNNSPATTSSHDWASSYSSLDESQIKACKLILEKISQTCCLTENILNTLFDFKMAQSYLINSPFLILLCSSFL